MCRFAYSKRLTKVFMIGAPFPQAFSETKHIRQNPIMRKDDEDGGGGCGTGSGSISGSTACSVM